MTKKKNIKHSCSSQKSSSGSPIINLKNFKVIGIHKGSSDKNFNYGSFIKNPIEDFYQKEKNNKIDNKYNYENSFNSKSIDIFFNIEGRLIYICVNIDMKFSVLVSNFMEKIGLLNNEYEPRFIFNCKSIKADSSKTLYELNINDSSYIETIIDE